MKERKKSTKRTATVVITAAVCAAALFVCLFFGKEIYERYFAPDVPLTVTASPSDATVEAGYTAVFEVAANGRGLTYSWEYTAPGGAVSVIKGNVGSRLSLVTDISMNGNVYRCTVTDRKGDSESTDGALLTVTKEHTFGAMLVTKENTCLNDGEATYVCSSCGEKKVEVLTAAGHDFNESVSYTGKRLFVCKTCSYSFETDAADKSALDDALKKIPEYVSVYCSGSSANTLAALRDRLETTVYGVKNYDLLSQKETDDYAERINSALEKLTLRKTDGKNIYLTSGENGSAVLSATDGQSTEIENAAAVLTDAQLYGETKKPSYRLTLADDKTLFSFDSESLLLLSLASDPTLMRTPLVYNAADRLGISEAPDYYMAEVWLDGEYLGLYAVRGEPNKTAENTEELQDVLLRLLSSENTYNYIKSRVDTARFSRFMILYCVAGLADCVNVNELLFEDNGKISVHLPTLCDRILLPDSQPNFAQELLQNDILAALLQNSDFMTEARYVYALNGDKLQNLCADTDAEENTQKETDMTAAAAKTADETADSSADSDEKTSDGSEAENDTNAAAANTDTSSFARFTLKYGTAIERNFADGAVTYDKSFGSITHFSTFDENARALAAALRARLAAAASYFAE